jgi:hypothetical protein
MSGKESLEKVILKQKELMTAPHKPFEIVQIPNGIAARAATRYFEKTYPLSETQMTEGIKLDSGKPRTELLDAEFLLDVSKVLTVGAKKYASHNWRNGISYGRLIGAILRHIFAILRGEDIDPEFGLPHSAHLGCEVMFLHWMMLNRKDLDDRYKQKVI